jgi:hypothetical protein
MPYVVFLRSSKTLGAFSLTESLFPIGPLHWKALWENPVTISYNYIPQTLLCAVNLQASS